MGRSNPGTLGDIGQLTQGVTMEDTIAAVGGLALAGMLPSMIITGNTTQQIWMKLGVGFAASLGAGYIAHQVLGKRTAAKAAVLGGLAGTTVTAINNLTTFKIGGVPGMRQLAGNSPQTLRRYPAPSRDEEFANVRVQ